MNSHKWSWSSYWAGLASALLLFAGIWTGFAVIAGQQDASQDAYLECLASLGFTPGSTSGDELDELLAATEACS